ncbi:MAG: phosphonopyruvate decarboxylase [Kiloniellales bacterium]
MAPWSEDALRALKEAEVRQAAYVPDSGLSRLIDLCQAESAIAAVPLTTEEEGIALVAGAWLGGQRGVLLMQSSGIGNCVNALSLTRTCRFPLLSLITMRGERGEFNPWQVPMGQIGGEVLRLAGVLVHRVSEPGQVGETVAAAARLAFHGPAAVAVLISQRVVGVKDFGN